MIITKEQKNKIYDLLRDNRFQQSLDFIYSLTNEGDKLRKQIVEITFAYKEIDNRGFQMDDQESIRLKTSLIGQLLEAVDDIEVKEEEIIKPLASFKDDFSMSIVRFTLAKLLVKNYGQNIGMHVTQIVIASRLKSRKFIVAFIKELEDQTLIIKTKKNSKTYWILNDKGHNILKTLFLSNQHAAKTKF